MSNEEKGRFLGFSESIGNMITYKVLTSNDKKIFRSRIRAGNLRRNLRIDDQHSRNIVSTRGQGSNVARSMAVIDPDDLIGRTYLTPPDTTGDRERVRIVKSIRDHDNQIINDPSMIKFRCVTDDGKVDELKTYNGYWMRWSHQMTKTASQDSGR